MKEHLHTFRVYNTKSKKWIYGPGEEVNIFGEYILMGEFMREVLFEDLNYCVVLQYTGLKDCNNKEIYEGDICKLSFYKYPEQPKEELIEEFIGEIFWYDYQSRFAFSRRNSDDMIYYIRNGNSRVEIISNIYEKPELVR